MTRMPSVLAVFGVVALTVLLTGAAMVAAPQKPQEEPLEARVARLEKELKAVKTNAAAKEQRIALLEAELSHFGTFLKKLEKAGSSLDSGVSDASSKGFTAGAIPAASREALLASLRKLAGDLSAAAKRPAAAKR